MQFEPPSTPKKAKSRILSFLHLMSFSVFGVRGAWAVKEVLFEVLINDLPDTLDLVGLARLFIHGNNHCLKEIRKLFRNLKTGGGSR